jgi:hypothetical protein
MTGQLPRWCWSHRRIECSSLRRNTGARCHGRPMHGTMTCRAHSAQRSECSARELAHQQVSAAVRDGVLIAPNACELCGSARGDSPLWGIHAHHEDYSRPLDVLWLCQSCHQRVHAVHGGLLAYIEWLRAQLAGAERLAERFAAAAS